MRGPFKLRSGNTVPFKQIGSSALKQDKTLKDKEPPTYTARDTANAINIRADEIYEHGTRVSDYPMEQTDASGSGTRKRAKRLLSETDKKLAGRQGFGGKPTTRTYLQMMRKHGYQTVVKEKSTNPEYQGGDVKLDKKGQRITR
tara:strand:- start:16 stop:447 length:432 start_codon:yes stop_codon:yes gene_type:complete